MALFSDIMELPAGFLLSVRLFARAVQDWPGWVALAAVGVVSWGCVGSEADIVKIGFLPTTGGQFKESGQGVVRAAELAVRKANEEGGILMDGRRRHVELYTRDVAPTPEDAVRAIQLLVNRDGVSAIVGPSLSEIAVPAAVYADQAGVPMVSPGAAHPDVTLHKTYVFRISSLDVVQGRVMGRFARLDLGAGTAAVLYDVTQAYSRRIAKEFGASFDAAGGRLVAFEEYTASDDRFEPQLAAIRHSGADVVYLPNYPDDVMRQARAVRSMGLDATLLGPGSWSLIPYDDEPEFQGSYYSSNWNHDVDLRESREFVTAYQSAFGEVPVTLAALTYDAFGLLFHALRVAGSVNSDLIRNALADVHDYPGVSGVVSYRGRGDPVRRIAIIGIDGGQRRFRKWMSP